MNVKQVGGKDSYWSEENVTTQVRESIIRLFKEIRFSGCEITSVTAEGEAFVTINRGKLFIIFDFQIRLDWRGKIFEGTDNFGSITFTIDQDSSEPETYKIYFQSESDSPQYRRTKESVRKEAFSNIKSVLTNLSTQLTEEYKCTKPVGIVRNKIEEEGNREVKINSGKKENQALQKQDSTSFSILPFSILLAASAVAIGGWIFYSRNNKS